MIASFHRVLTDNEYWEELNSHEGIEWDIMREIIRTDYLVEWITRIFHGRPTNRYKWIYCQPDRATHYRLNRDPNYYPITIDTPMESVMSDERIETLNLLSTSWRYK